MRRYTDLGSADRMPLMAATASSGPFKNWNFGLVLSMNQKSIRNITIAVIRKKTLGIRKI